MTICHIITLCAHSCGQLTRNPWVWAHKPTGNEHWLLYTLDEVPSSSHVKYTNIIKLFDTFIHAFRCNKWTSIIWWFDCWILELKFFVILQMVNLFLGWLYNGVRLISYLWSILVGGRFHSGEDLTPVWAQEVVLLATALVTFLHRRWRIIVLQQHSITQMLLSNWLPLRAEFRGRMYASLT